MKPARFVLKCLVSVGLWIVIVDVLWSYWGPTADMGVTEMLARAEGQGIVRANVEPGERRVTVTLADDTKRDVTCPDRKCDVHVTDQLKARGVEVIGAQATFWRTELTLLIGLSAAVAVFAMWRR